MADSLKIRNICIKVILPDTVSKASEQDKHKGRRNDAPSIVAVSRLFTDTN